MALATVPRKNDREQNEHGMHTTTLAERQRGERTHDSMLRILFLGSLSRLSTVSLEFCLLTAYTFSSATTLLLVVCAQIHRIC